MYKQRNNFKHGMSTDKLDFMCLKVYMNYSLWATNLLSETYKSGFYTITVYLVRTIVESF